MGAEKRRDKRHAKRFMIRFGEKAFSNSGFTTDVSQSGLFIASTTMPKLWTRIHLEITLDGERQIFTEAIVVRHVVVDKELRSIKKGGFGVRYCSGGELLHEMVPQLREKPRVQVRYDNLAKFQDAYAKELSKGGMFVWSATYLPQDSLVTVEVDCTFAAKAVTLDGRILNSIPDSTGTRYGTSVIFLDQKAAKDVLVTIAQP